MSELSPDKHDERDQMRRMAALMKAFKSNDASSLEVCNFARDIDFSIVAALLECEPSPCGHSSQYAYSEDGGKNMICLLCERQRLIDAYVTQVATHGDALASMPSHVGKNDEAVLWHKVFRHYFHDGMEECRHCGLPRADRIHNMDPLPVNVAYTPSTTPQKSDAAKREHWRQWAIDGMPADKMRLAEATWEAAASALSATPCIQQESDKNWLRAQRDVAEEKVKDFELQAVQQGLLAKEIGGYLGAVVSLSGGARRLLERAEKALAWPKQNNSPDGGKQT